MECEGGVDQTTWDLSVKNPNRNDEVVLREPKVILEEMGKLNKEAGGILAGIKSKF